jgi:hypothetical protein
MVGPRPAGAPWTPDDDRKLAAMIAAGDDKTIIARKLKRPVTAIKARLAKLPSASDGRNPLHPQANEGRPNVAGEQ